MEYVIYLLQANNIFIFIHIDWDVTQYVKKNLVRFFCRSAGQMERKACQGMTKVNHVWLNHVCAYPSTFYHMNLARKSPETFYPQTRRPPPSGINFTRWKGPSQLCFHAFFHYYFSFTLSFALSLSLISTFFIPFQWMEERMSGILEIIRMKIYHGPMYCGEDLYSSR